MTTTCVESGLLLTLKFSPPFEVTPTQNGFSDPKDATGGWDFLQALTTAATKNSGDQPEAPVYVHPLVKRSESMLSEKSLEMCTESLFSETGSDDTTVELPSLPETYPAREISRRRRAGRSSGELPPPLPSISGAGGVQVEAMREGGRLVMKAVRVSPVHACFKAERGDGRLRLSFSDECGRRCCNDMGDEEDESEDNGCGCDEERREEEGGSGKIENYGGRLQGSMSRCNEEENMKKREMDNISQGAYWVATS